MRMKTGMEQAVYTLLILVRLPKRTSLPAEPLSERLGVSPSYLKKLMQKLVHAGLVHSTPGIRGGFSLAKQPEDVTVYDIYVAVEGCQSLYLNQGVSSHLFADEKTCSSHESCALEILMKDAEKAWTDVLKAETLASLQEKVTNTYPQHKLLALETWIHEQINGGTAQ